MTDTPAPAAESGDAPTAQPEKTRVVREWETTSPLIACRFDPLGRYVVASAQDQTLLRWDLASGEAIPLVGHESWVRGLAIDPTGTWLVSGGYDQRLIWWPLADANPAPARIGEAHGGWVRGVAISPDGQLIATCGNDHRVKLWSLDEGSLVHELVGHESHVYNVAFHPSGQFLVSGDLKGIVRQWDVASGSAMRQLDASRLYKYDEGFRADIGGLRSIAFSPDGRYLACGGITDVTNAFAGVGNPAVVVFDWEADEPLQVLLSKEGLQGVCWGLAFHPEGYLIGALGGQGGGSLMFWQPSEQHEFFRFNLPTTALDAALHPAGLQVAVAFYDKKLRLYEMAEAQPEAAAG